MASAPDKPSREQLKADWWKRWWEEDYSWAGLVKHKIEGTGGLHGEKTLQEYWRRDPANPSVVRDDAEMEAEGELVRAPDGALWHLAHIPWVWKDGAAAKSGWEEAKRHSLRDRIGKRLSVAQSSIQDPFRDLKVYGQDGRAQLSGSVFTPYETYFPSATTIYVCCESAWLPALQVIGRKFGELTSFSGSALAGDASFQSATFLNGVSFDNAIFLGQVVFDGATIAGKARLRGATFFESAHFGTTNFSEDAFFDGAVFCDAVNFLDAHFSGDARFDYVTFAGAAFFIGPYSPDSLAFQVYSFLESQTSLEQRFLELPGSKVLPLLGEPISTARSSQETLLFTVLNSIVMQVSVMRLSLEKSYFLV